MDKGHRRASFEARGLEDFSRIHLAISAPNRTISGKTEAAGVAGRLRSRGLIRVR